MKSSRLVATALFFLACLSACSKHDSSTSSDQPDINIPAVGNHMLFESSVSGERVAALNESISSIYQVTLDPSEVDVISMARMMKVDDVRPEALQQWLEKRVSYVVNDGFDIQAHASLADGTANYPFPNDVPDAIKGKLKKNVDGSIDAQVIMLNIGAISYFLGKYVHRLVNLSLDGIGVVPLVSPRIGLLEIGPGMFPDMQGKKVQNILLDIFRAGILFHEARHSDGHGVGLGFMHAVCPPGSDYAGINACDASTNGPYTIGSMMQKNLMKACGSRCTEHTMTVLELYYLDLSDRLVTSFNVPGTSAGAEAGTAWDDAPEAIQP